MFGKFRKTEIGGGWQVKDVWGWGDGRRRMLGGGGGGIQLNPTTWLSSFCHYSTRSEQCS